MGFIAQVYLHIYFICNIVANKINSNWNSFRWWRDSSHTLTLNFLALSVAKFVSRIFIFTYFITVVEPSQNICLNSKMYQLYHWLIASSYLRNCANFFQNFHCIANCMPGHLKLSVKESTALKFSRYVETKHAIKCSISRDFTWTLTMRNQWCNTNQSFFFQLFHNSH